MFLKNRLVIALTALLLLGSVARTAERPAPSREKEFVFKVVDRNSKAIALLGDNIYYFAELGLQEFETAKLMTQILQDAGFKVERGISGMPTAFMATYGSGKPVIAIHTEYDTTPGNSQTPGVPEHKPLVEGAPGHAEGHNVNAAVMIGAAFAVKKAMDEYKLPGTLKIFGAPAEELLLPRPYFVRDGYFKDVDLAFHTHIGEQLRTDRRCRSEHAHVTGRSRHRQRWDPGRYRRCESRWCSRCERDQSESERHGRRSDSRRCRRCEPQRDARFR